MTYAICIPGEPEILNFMEIHRSAARVARDVYFEKYGVNYHDDPEWDIGNDRHTTWLTAYEARQTSLMINPHQQ